MALDQKLEKAVDCFSQMMKQKLEEEEQNGKRGWESMSEESFIRSIINELQSGKYINVANYAMMAYTIAKEGSNGA